MRFTCICMGIWKAFSYKRLCIQPCFETETWLSWLGLGIFVWSDLSLFVGGKRCVRTQKTAFLECVRLGNFPTFQNLNPQCGFRFWNVDFRFTIKHEIQKRIHRPRNLPLYFLSIHLFFGEILKRNGKMSSRTVVSYVLTSRLLFTRRREQFFTILLRISLKIKRLRVIQGLRISKSQSRFPSRTQP